VVITTRTSRSARRSARVEQIADLALEAKRVQPLRPPPRAHQRPHRLVTRRKLLGNRPTQQAGAADQQHRHWKPSMQVLAMTR
jgi:hypothetical protein